MKENKFCQSCGYPLNKDKNWDGSKYCSMCYKDGKFLSPKEIDTSKKFQEYCISEMKKDGMNGILAWFLTRGIPKLERWKK